MPDIQYEYFPDSLFYWYPYFSSKNSYLPSNGDFIIPHQEQNYYFGKLDFSIPYICIGGSALSSNMNSEAIQGFSILYENLSELGYKIYFTINDGPDLFLESVAKEFNAGIVPLETPVLLAGSVLANARLNISGRYHPGIFASLGGTPCIFLDSSAHKTISLQVLLKYPETKIYPFILDDHSCSEILQASKTFLAQGTTIREEIKETARLRYEEVRKLPEFILEHF
jgi:hypothetical protein